MSRVDPDNMGIRHRKTKRDTFKKKCLVTLCNGLEHDYKDL